MALSLETTCSCLGIEYYMQPRVRSFGYTIVHARLAAYADGDLHEACQAMLRLPMTLEPA
jgi:hypothetical protein